LAEIFSNEADEHKLSKEFKVQFADDHISRIEDNVSIFKDKKVTDREWESVEMTIGGSEYKHYAKLLLNHGNDDGSYVESSSQTSTLAGRIWCRLEFARLGRIHVCTR
jgi:hypothetical protein